MDKQPRSPEVGKRRYTSPEFKIFGDLGSITASVGNSGNMDGGTGKNNQTMV